MIRCILTCLIFVITTVSSIGQTYHPLLDSMSNTWHFTANWIPVKLSQPAVSGCDYNYPTQYSRIESAGDTIMGSFAYKMLDRYELFAGFIPCRYGYMREDTTARKVYFVPNDLSPEFVLYDFSMVQGDQIYLDFAPGNAYPAGNYVLDTVFSIPTIAGLRNLYNLLPVAAPWSDPVQWIEGVGCPSGLAYTKGAWFGGGLFSSACFNDPVVRMANELLLCFEHDSVKAYFDSCAHAYAFNNFCFYYTDSCYFYNICGSLEELSSPFKMQIFPNPFKDTFVIDFESPIATEGVFVVSDLHGKTLYVHEVSNLIPGHNEIQVQLPELASGNYLLTFSSGNFPPARQLVTAR